MRTALRLIGLVAALAPTIGTPGAPASAMARSGGAVLFEAAVHINCFGCGDSNGTASFCVTGTANGSAFAGCGYEGQHHRGRRAVIGGGGVATYTVHEDNAIGVECVISGTANGTSATSGTALGRMSGAISGTFTWTRVGAVALMATAGDINGVGTAVFAVTSPVGPPCGGAVDAVAIGQISGV